MSETASATLELEETPVDTSPTAANDTRQELVVSPENTEILSALNDNNPDQVTTPEAELLPPLNDNDPVGNIAQETADDVFLIIVFVEEALTPQSILNTLAAQAPKNVTIATDEQGDVACTNISLVEKVCDVASKPENKELEISLGPDADGSTLVEIHIPHCMSRFKATIPANNSGLVRLLGRAEEIVKKTPISRRLAQ